MGFLSREHSNIDPFNAGEPVMPWDDPQAQQGEQENPIFNENSQGAKECGYHAPIKEQDAYEPVEHDPEHDGAPAGALTSALSANDEQTHATEKKARGSEHTNKRASRRVTVATSKGSAASKRRPPRLVVCIIAGLVAISVLINVAGIVAEIIDSVVFEINNASSSYSSSYSANSKATYSYEDEQELNDVVQKKLDSALADTAGMDARYLKVLNDRLEWNLEASAEELGLDTEAFCSWMRENTTMEISSVFCDEDASVYLKSEYPALYRLNEAFGDKAFAYLTKQGIDVYASDGGKQLTDKQKQHVNELFIAALDSLDETTYGSANFEAGKEGGTWEVDEDDFDEVLDQLLGYYED